MNITDELEKESIIAYLKSKNKNEVIRELTNHISKLHPNINTDQAYEVIIEREIATDPTPPT